MGSRGPGQAEVGFVRPWDRAHPEFAYSESREARRRRCARAYYHAIYTAHRGWAATLGSASYLAYRLKKAVPLAAAIGGAIHAAAAECVCALMAGRALPSHEELRATAAGQLNALWRSSRGSKEAFWRRPAAVPMFEEALYGVGPNADALRRAREKLDRCLTGLLDCGEVWRMVAGAAVGDVVLMEPFYSFVLPDEVLSGGLRCYAAADLLVRPARDGPWVIVDFKTGAVDGAIDQVLLYALAAREGLGLDLVSGGCHGLLVALDARSAERLLPFSISEADIEAAAAQMRANVAAQRALLVDPIANIPQHVEAFAQTADRRQCGTCTYRALCYPDLYGIAPPASAP